MAFKDGFIWGAGTSSYQIEGAAFEDGKGMNLWDAFAGYGDTILNGETGAVACDHYHRFREDVALMKKLGIKAYRFSINWPRVLPKGVGEVSKKGLKFYSDLVDELIEAGIEPMVTLFHWEYPYELYRQGGWLNDNSSDWFLEYTKVVVDALSDRVTHWMTLNEPQCELGNGYGNGKHAPFQQRQPRDLLIMGHNMILSHGKAADYIRHNAKKPAKIGWCPTGPVTCPKVEPADCVAGVNGKHDSRGVSFNEGNNDPVTGAKMTQNYPKPTPEAIEAARKASYATNGAFFTHSTSYWCDPVFLGKYPDTLIEDFGDLVPKFTEEEWKLVTTKLDFFGYNVYFESGWARQGESQYPANRWMSAPLTNIGWPVNPEVMYWSAKFHYERYGLPLFITENGMASHDWISEDGKVHDSYRIDYTARFLRQLDRAGSEGVELYGYMHWSVMDNFEWAWGYTMRFGLIYVDFNTQQRVLKDSANWYREVCESNGDILFK